MRGVLHVVPVFATINITRLVVLPGAQGRTGVERLCGDGVRACFLGNVVPVL